MAPKTKKLEHPEELAPQPPPPAEVEFAMLSTDLIDDPEQPMRSELTEASVEDLVVSIKQVGIIEPLVVKLTNARYEVIAGHRRLYASKLAKIPEVPCYIRKANSEQTEMLKAHENLYRANVRPTEEATYFDRLIQKQHITPAKIANIMGKSVSYVTDRLDILHWPEILRAALTAGEISFSVAKEFSRFGSDLSQMSSAIYYAKRGGMTAELAQKWVADHQRTIQRQQIQDVPQPNGHIGTPIEHTATCVYCQKGLRLIEAEVVYMHTACLRNVNEPAPETETAASQ